MTAELRVFPVAAAHRGRIAELLAATGAFNDSEVAVALELFDEAMSASAPAAGVEPDYNFVGVFTPERELAGFACYGPTPDTDATFDLYWLAVDPSLAGTGAGTLLLTEVEQRLRTKDARMVVAETSSRDDYEAARWFYARRGYTEAGRVADFYAWSDDRIIFTKRLTPATAGSARHTQEHQGVNR
ncbi:MAG: GNAT family N-acetyltransferase [Gemmatimonadaceae bacterium]